jgi:hypothetical protein
MPHFHATGTPGALEAAEDAAAEEGHREFDPAHYFSSVGSHG